MVSQIEINEMKRLQYLLKGETPPQELLKSINNNNIVSDIPAILSTTPGKKEISQMTNLLKIMEGELPKMIKESHNNQKMREALTTVKIPNGIQIGSWELVTNIQEGINAKNETYYSIINADNNQRIDEEIFDYTAAMSIVRLLNNGSHIGSNSISNIVTLDKEYQRLRLKAMQEKYNWHKVKNTDNEWRQDLYEAKFSAIKYKALYVKEQIKNVSLVS